MLCCTRNFNALAKSSHRPLLSFFLDIGTHYNMHGYTSPYMRLLLSKELSSQLHMVCADEQWYFHFFISSHFAKLCEKKKNLVSALRTLYICIVVQFLKHVRTSKNQYFFIVKFLMCRVYHLAHRMNQDSQRCEVPLPHFISAWLAKIWNFASTLPLWYGCYVAIFTMYLHCLLSIDNLKKKNI